MSIKQLIVRINECSYFFHRDGNYSFFFVCLISNGSNENYFGLGKRKRK